MTWMKETLRGNARRDDVGAGACHHNEHVDFGTSSQYGLHEAYKVDL